MSWRAWRLAHPLVLPFLLASCMSSEAVVIESQPEPEPVASAPVFEQIGKASWYGPWHHGRLTASGERFDMNQLTAAHRTLPLDTRARVTNLANGRSVEVTVNDRGPYVKDRVIDLSAKAAKELDLKKQGVGRVKIEVMPESAAIDNDVEEAFAR